MDMSRHMGWLVIPVGVALSLCLCSGGQCQQPLKNTVVLPDGSKVQSSVVINGEPSGQPFEETWIIYVPPIGQERRQLEFGIHKHHLDIEQALNPNRLSAFGMSRFVRNMELSAEQIDDINAVQTRFAEQVAQWIQAEYEKAGGDTLPVERLDELKRRVSDLGNETEAAAFAVLLPHQVEQFQQTVVQNEFIRKGGRAFLSDVLAEALELTASQKEEIKSITSRTAREISDARKELDEQINEMEAKAESEVLAILSPEQKKKLEELRGSLRAFSKQQ